MRRLYNLHAGLGNLLLPHRRGTVEEIVLDAGYWSAESFTIRRIVDASRKLYVFQVLLH